MLGYLNNVLAINDKGKNKFEGCTLSRKSNHLTETKKRERFINKLFLNSETIESKSVFKKM